MAISFENSNSFASASNAFDAGVGTGRIMIFMLLNVSNNTRPNAPSFNSVNSTFVREDTTNSLNFSLWYLIAPTTGSHNVVIDTGNSVAVGVYNGAKQSGQPDASTNSQSSANQTSYTHALTTVADNAWVVCTGFFNNGGTISGGTNATQRTGSFGMFINDTNGPITPGSTSVSQTVSSTVNQVIGIKLMQISIAPSITTTTTVTNISLTITMQLVAKMIRTAIANITLSISMQSTFLRYLRTLIVGFTTLSITFQDVITRLGGWVRQSKNSSNFSNQSKNSASYSNQTKNSSSFSGGTKHSSSWTNDNKNSSTFTNQTKQ